jgi:hypothetical protein
MTTTHRPLPAVLALAAVPLLVLGLAACSPGDGDAASGVKSESELVAAAAKWDAALTSCLSSNGLDREPNEDGSTEAFSMDDGSAETLEKCSDEVSADLGPRPVSAAEKEQTKSGADAARKAAACLRDKGYDAPDPTSDGMATMPSDVSDEDADACYGATGGGGAVTVEK